MCVFLLVILLLIEHDILHGDDDTKNTDVV